MIRNIPYTKEENTETLVRAIATAKNINLGQDVKCFRALSKTASTDRPNNKHPKIIITNLDQTTRDKLKKQPPIQTDEIRYTFPDQKTPTKIFIEENLTTEELRLFYLTREKRKRLGYKYAWTKAGIPHLRETDDSETFTIKTERDLDNIPTRASMTE